MFQVLDQRPYVGRDIVELRFEARQTLGERPEPRVELAELPSLAGRGGRRVARTATLCRDGVADCGTPPRDTLAVLRRCERMAGIQALYGAQLDRRARGGV